MEKEYEIMKQIYELYSGDITDSDFLKHCENQKSKSEAWKQAFKEYPLDEVKKAISFYYTNKSSTTRPNIAQIKAILSANNAHYEQPKEETKEVYEPDYDIKYFDEDVNNGNCHHNRYYYTEALEMIRKHEYPFVADIQHPTHNEMITVIKHICESRTKKKHEFLSRNDLIELGYDMNRHYSTDELLEKSIRRI